MRAGPGSIWPTMASRMSLGVTMPVIPPYSSSRMARWMPVLRNCSRRFSARMVSGRNSGLRSRRRMSSGLPLGEVLPQVAQVDDPDHAVQLAVAHNVAGVRMLDRRPDGRLERVVDVQPHDLRARRHDRSARPRPRARTRARRLRARPRWNTPARVPSASSAATSSSVTVGSRCCLTPSSRTTASVDTLMSQTAGRARTDSPCISGATMTGDALGAVQRDPLRHQLAEQERDVGDRRRRPRRPRAGARRPVARAPAGAGRRAAAQWWPHRTRR